MQALVGALYPCENRSMSLVLFKDHLYIIFINVFNNLLLLFQLLIVFFFTKLVIYNGGAVP